MMKAHLAPVDDPAHGQDVLGRVYEFLGRFISYPDDNARVAHALWCLHAHMMHLWDSTPRLAFLSAEPASGKSRALEITELVVPRAVATVNVSPAYIFRRIGMEELPPTILYDEIDTVFGPKAKENEELRGLLNAGHRRGAKVGRCVTRGKAIEVEDHPAFAAVALAGLGWLPDTLLTRSVVIRMQRRRPDERVEPFRRRLHEKDGEVVRATIEEWVAAQPKTVRWPALPPEIQDRDADVWEPLIAVADMVGGDWPERARSAAVALVTAAREGVPKSLGIRLLADMRTVFDGRDKMATEAILEGLRGLDEAPWGDIGGKQLDDRGLATRLKEYGVKPKAINFGGKTSRGYMARGQKPEDNALSDAWVRYLSERNERN